MSDLAKLREEHAQLAEIVRRLGMIIAEPNPTEQTRLFALRRELSSTLIAHLKAEDWLLYPRLFASPNKTVAKTARVFSDEMGGLAQVYSAYAEKWPAGAIHQDWPGYCHDTHAIIQALTCRINRENRELYPLLAVIDKAA